MKWVLRILGIWTIADAVFLLFAPTRWARWWNRWLVAIGKGWLASRLFALLELASGLYLLQRSFVKESRLLSGASTTPGQGRADRAAFNVGKSGLLGAIFHVPIPLYNRGFGWLFGHRFLMLTHRGRKSGRPYQTVLEVVRYDPVTKESIVLSGWGTRADWYRNIRANPPIAVAIGRDCYQPTYRELSAEEAPAVLADYLQQNPPVFRWLVERMLFGEAATEEEKREKARSFVMIAFRPAGA